MILKTKNIADRIDLYLQDPSFWKEKLRNKESDKTISIAARYLETSLSGATIAKQFNVSSSRVHQVVRLVLSRIWRMKRMNEILPPITEKPISLEANLEKQLLHSLRIFIQYEIRKSIEATRATPEAITSSSTIEKKSPPDLTKLEEITDEGNQGILLNSIKKALAQEDIDRFITWHKGRQSGIYESQVYILKDNWVDFIDKYL